jgi:hypothetical protein
MTNIMWAEQLIWCESDMKFSSHMHSEIQLAAIAQ